MTRFGVRVVYNRMMEKYSKTQSRLHVIIAIVHLAASESTIVKYKIKECPK